MSSQITGIPIACSIICSGADQRKRHSSASLAFARGIHRSAVDSSHKWPVTYRIKIKKKVIFLWWNQDSLASYSRIWGQRITSRLNARSQIDYTTQNRVLKNPDSAYDDDLLAHHRDALSRVRSLYPTAGIGSHLALELYICCLILVVVWHTEVISILWFYTRGHKYGY